MQCVAYRTVKSWIRWLRQPHLDQDSERLQRSWLRMHDFAYPAGTSSRGLIAPPLMDPTSQWTAVTLWTAILASIGWKWIAPYSLLGAVLYAFEDNEAVIKMIIKGRSPTMRHVPRTHRVTLDWLFDRVNLDPKIQITIPFKTNSNDFGGFWN